MDNPILSSFRLRGLHGYKDVEIECPSKARIVIAGNGSGKTTIFSALYSVLSGQFHRLSSLDFETVECQFASEPDSIVIRKSDIAELPIESLEQISQMASRITGLTSDDLTSFLLFEYQIGNIAEQVRNHITLRNIYSRLPGDYSAVGASLDALATALRRAMTPNEQLAGERVRTAMAGVQVLYLPTYRRIELPLLQKRKKGAVTFAEEEQQIFAEGSAETKHINFGLADVERRLNELAESVERQSNIEYRNISATILDEALADQISGWSQTGDLPDIENLRRFLSRVTTTGPFEFFLGPTSAWGPRPTYEGNERRIQAINNLYLSGEIGSEKQTFLRYFLSRLGSVIERTKATETMLQRFVEACNGYLTESTDEKVFLYDANATRVRVVDSWSKREIPLGSLSSGEKQVVSILARLYLYSQERFVLIDEPELSLSMDWQRRILPDIVKSGSVRQLFAITHSPFIFENELDPWAGSMRVHRRLTGRGMQGGD